MNKWWQGFFNILRVSTVGRSRCSCVETVFDFFQIRTWSLGSSPVSESHAALRAAGQRLSQLGILMNSKMCRVLSENSIKPKPNKPRGWEYVLLTEKVHFGALSLFSSSSCPIDAETNESLLIMYAFSEGRPAELAPRFAPPVSQLRLLKEQFITKWESLLYCSEPCFCVIEEQIEKGNFYF